MCGNGCRIAYHDDYNGAPTDGSAWTSGDCSNRVVRGGSWADFPQNLRSADRLGVATDFRNNFLGFRVGRTLLPLEIFTSLPLGSRAKPSWLTRGATGAAGSHVKASSTASAAPAAWRCWRRCGADTLIEVLLDPENAKALEQVRLDLAEAVRLDGVLEKRRASRQADKAAGGR